MIRSRVTARVLILLASLVLVSPWPLAGGPAFAADDSPSELVGAFEGLRAAVSAVANEADADTLTEVFWAALHGLATLGRGGRLRPDYHRKRVDLLIAQFGP